MLSVWSSVLCNIYCRLRAEKRNKAVRRSSYRLIEKERLRLAEMGVCQGCIKVTCRYLAGKPRAQFKICEACEDGVYQLTLDFT